MNHFNQISAEYKKGFIDDVLNGMTPLLDNVQLRELNRVLNYHTSQLDFGEGLIDTNSDYEVQNKKLLVQYIKSKKVEGLSNRTIDYYENTLKKLEEWTVKSFINLTHTDIMEFLVFYQELNQCSKISIDNIRRILSSFFGWLELEEYIIINPMRKIPKVKFEKKVKKAFTDKEIEIMRNDLENRKKSKFKVRNQAIFEFLLSSGVRVSELCGIDTYKVNFEDNSVIVLGKGNKERLVYFSERAGHLLQVMIKERGNKGDGALFLNGKYKRLGKSGVERLIRELGAKYNIEAHPHKFRRTFATRLVRKGMPIDQVQQLLGHTSLEVTLQYVEADEESLKRVHNRFVS